MPLSEAWFFRIKSAQQDLIMRCGGIVRAAEKCSSSKTEVGRWNNQLDPDLMPLPAVLQLEEVCGVPVVTSAMAELNGRRLADPEAFGTANATMMAAHAEVVVQFGELIAKAAMAFSDGKLTPAELAGIDRGAAALERAVAELRKSAASARAAGGLSIVGGVA
ncbi:phage regulatory CII family protein [Mesorhizobium sp.]|uniref:phage regulatory CII family protein n=1 Tax=Mesorhizobium sp. TaxID=1871066 RepID=UPI000FE83A0B|nr:phage regulatory CII family protein [Mesorhizobium sp.]RWD71624.1 MAG: hypothetical protein EOS37_10965 [Mesorhizobium sp.]